MVVKRFEEIQAWQKARDLTNEIYRLPNQSLCVKDFGLRDQIRRASVSVMSNRAEGFERHSNVECMPFLLISKASVAEVRSLFSVVQAQQYIRNMRTNSLAVVHR
jgi:four helix bundle protein